jgi:hypothetical protein
VGDFMSSQDLEKILGAINSVVESFPQLPSLKDLSRLNFLVNMVRSIPARERQSLASPIESLQKNVMNRIQQSFTAYNSNSNRQEARIALEIAASAAFLSYGASVDTVFQESVKFFNTIDKKVLTNDYFAIQGDSLQGRLLAQVLMEQSVSEDGQATPSVTRAGDALMCAHVFSR